MPALIFFSAVVHLLYALGFIQYIILKISFIVNKLMSTSPTESTYTVSTVFVGMVIDGSMIWFTSNKKLSRLSNQIFSHLVWSSFNNQSILRTYDWFWIVYNYGSWIFDCKFNDNLRLNTSVYVIVNCP